MQLLPVNEEWCHSYILEPYAEGVEYLNLFWEGVDRSLEKNCLSLTDRVVCLLKGTLLMIPLLNTIIWIAW
ncbi:MAG: hypothetical protein KGQ49_04490, partial [Verrucomicrobia bacterium]|nr:hypothetical protein [Verrucomicrobiota bacterium]